MVFPPFPYQMRNIAVCQPDAYLKGVSRYFYTTKKQAVGKHVILPSEKVMAPANTNAAYSPMLKPAVLTQFSMACRKKVMSIMICLCAFKLLPRNIV